MSANLTIYRASAGSGKTFRLSAEYIALLLNGEPDMHRHILAVTFTNKATCEMKERILQYLWDVANSTEEKPSNSFETLLCSLLPSLKMNTIRKRAQKALHSIVHDYDHFHVVTIDSFFQTLLSNLAHELGLSASFKVDLNDKEVIEKAVDRLMTELPERKEVLNWVLKYIEQRIEEDKKWDIREEVINLGKELTKERFMSYEIDLTQRLSDERQLNILASKMDKMREAAEKNIKEAANSLYEQIEQQGKGFSDISYGQKVVGGFLNKLKAGNFDDPTDAVNNMLNGNKSWLKKNDIGNKILEDRMQTNQQLLQSVEEIRQKGVETINSCSLTLQLLSPLRLLDEINRLINELNFENNRFMLSKTPLLFHQLIGADDSPFVFEKAGVNFQHILIDEFQDTSPMQWSNLKKLLIENMSQGNKCLLVGDVKQGIYRFRGGDWNILENIQHEVKNASPSFHSLKENFRSSNSVVDFNNTFFPIAANLIDQLVPHQGVSKIYHDVIQESSERSRGFVRVKLSDRDENLKDFAEQVIALNQKGVDYKDMAILLRFNYEAPRILEYFTTNYPQIPIVSDEVFLLSSSAAISVLIHALRYLQKSSNSISKTFLSQYYLKHIIKLENTWNAEEFEEKLPPQIVENFEKWRNMPLYELCETLIEVLKLNELEGSSPYLFAFLDVVISFLDEHPSSISKFLEEWDESYYRKAVAMGSIDGIRILTIHKSKGLAFHTVLIPFCEWELGKDRKNDLLWCEPKSNPYDELPLVPVSIYNSKKVQRSVYSNQYEFEHSQQRIENLNLLYVAFTRAKENLYIWASPNKQSQLNMRSSIADLIEQTIDKMQLQRYLKEDGVWELEGRIPKKKEETEAKKNNPLIINSEELDIQFEPGCLNAQFRQSNDAKDFFKPKEDNREKKIESMIRGNLLHQLFAQINTADDVEKVVDEALQKGIISDQRERNELKKWINERLKSVVEYRWFEKGSHIFNECTILSRRNSIVFEKRPDRVIRTEGKITVIDYKFGKPSPKHKEQVSEYIHLIKGMGNETSIEGYVWYVETGEVVRV